MTTRDIGSRLGEHMYTSSFAVVIPSTARNAALLSRKLG